MKRLFLLYLWLTFLNIFPLQAKPPELTDAIAGKKIEEILKSHISYKQIDPPLMARVLENFLDSLDPLKTYLLADEIEAWTTPGEETLEELTLAAQNQEFTKFSPIYDKMLIAIERRNAIENEIKGCDLPEDVQAEEFLEVDWAQNKEQLKNRLLRIRALQVQSAEKLENDIKDKIFERITKMRLSNEEEIKGQNPQMRYKQMLAFVIKAVCNSLDNHTTYFTPQEASQFVIHVQQRLFGIGAHLRDDLNGLTIVELLEGGPAKKSGKIQENDRIISVNDEPIIGMNIQDAVELIRGPKGSSVKLTLLREKTIDGEVLSKTVHIDIQRDEIVLNESRYNSFIEPFGDGVIGCIKLHCFYQDPSTSSAKDIKAEIEKIRQENKLLGLIIDIRNNSGGLLPQAVAVTGLFIKNGVVASIKDDSGVVHHLRNFDRDISWNGPLIILCNRTSASAAEILAQALKDYGRAILVGDKCTYGKGSYQVFTLEGSNSLQVNPEGEYKVTRGIYYTVSGKSPQLVGTEVDIEIPGPFSKADIGECFAKYPLANDEIRPSFEDDLSDVHPLHRMRLRKSYLTNLQKKSDYLQKFIPKLIENSKNRMEQNPNYQQFLKTLHDNCSNNERSADYGLNDLQLEEALNVMKDFILLSQ